MLSRLLTTITIPPYEKWVAFPVVTADAIKGGICTDKFMAELCAPPEAKDGTAFVKTVHVMPSRSEHIHLRVIGYADPV